jgi:hypothetical protein
MLSEKTIRWLNNRACEDDILVGAHFIGHGAGTCGTDWFVTDEDALLAFIDGLATDYTRRHFA